MRVRKRLDAGKIRKIGWILVFWANFLEALYFFASEVLKSIVDKINDFANGCLQNLQSFAF